MMYNVKCKAGSYSNRLYILLFSTHYIYYYRRIL